MGASGGGEKHSRLILHTETAAVAVAAAMTAMRGTLLLLLIVTG